MTKRLARRSSRTALGSATALAVLGAALLLVAVVVGRSPCHALVDAVYSLKQVMDESKVIVEGEIEAVDQTQRTATAKVKTVIKGKCPFKQIKMNISVGQVWYPEVLMKRLKVGAPVLFFWDDGLRCLAYTNGHFFQVYGQANPDPNAVWWNFTHIETRMNRTFKGTTQELTAIVKDVVAGKRAPPPPDPTVLQFTRDELLGTEERVEMPPFSPTDEPDGLEAWPQWKADPGSRPAKASVFFAPPPGAAASEITPGLLGEYYRMREALTDFPEVGERKPDLVRADAQLNFASAPFPGTNFAENFYVRWTGFLKVPKDGKYKFYTAADDVAHFVIDGKLVAGIAGEHGALERGGEIELGAGDHNVRVDYFQGSGNAVCKLLWEGAGIPKDVVPENALFHRTVGPRGELLRLEFLPGTQEKVAISRKMEDDYTHAKRLLYEARNETAKPVRVAWGFTTIPGDRYYESPSMELPPGTWVYDLQVDLTAETFKSAATQWLCRSPLLSRGKVVKLTFVVYNAPPAGSLLVDRVRADCGSLFVRSIPLPHAGGKQGSVSWVDCNGDGKLDAFFCNESGVRLYRNVAGEFGDVSTTVFPADLRERKGGGNLLASWADCDGDGKPELLFSTGALLHYDKGTYAAADMGVALPGGSAAQEAVWLDANGDGRPDILLAGKQGTALLLNTGQGAARFKDVGAAWGVAALAAPLGLSPADCDGDGFTDILAYQATGLLLRNDDGKSFRPLASARLDYSAAQPVGAAWGDFDNDGNLDLFVPQAGKCHLYRNNGDLTFTDVTEHAGDLARLTGNVRTAVWGDVNLDGRVDLIVGFAEAPARIYLGDGKGKFSLGPPLGAFECTRGASGLALADWDGDGDLDLLVIGEKTAGILINQCPRPPGMSALRVRLPADQALGALVRLYDSVDKPIGVRQLGLAGCFGSQEPPEAFFAVRAGNHKVMVVFTNGVTKQTPVRVDDKGCLLKVTKD